nr:hypothetical protein [Tanacetum cinerariifolium]
MHNNIMATGLSDRPPMLATGRYAQWQSRFLRYIDTRLNGGALWKCILQGPYTPSRVTIPAVPTIDDTSTILERITVKTILNISPENKAHYESKKEAIHLLLTRIRNEIYLTIDSCKTAYEMWIAIERLQQGESLNIQDVKTNLFWEFGKFTSHDGESMESYYSRFYKIMNQNDKKQLDVLKGSYEIRAKRIAKNANLLALVATASPYPDPYYQAPKSHKPYAPTLKQSSSTRSIASTKCKDWAVWKAEDSDCCWGYRDYRQSGSASDWDIVFQLQGIWSFCKGMHETKKEQSDWLADTYEEIDKQELKAHNSYMEKMTEVPTTDSGTYTEPLKHVQYDTEYNVFSNERQHSEQPESISNTCVVEKFDSNVIADSLDIFDEIKEMSETSVANDTSGPVLQRQIPSNYNNSGHAPQLQNVSPSADTTIPSLQELDLLFGPLYDEFFSAGTSSVNKSSFPTDNSKQQDTPPTMNIQSSTKPTTPTKVNAEENNDNQEVDTQVQQDNFINPFCTLAMADSAWIETMQEEFHQLDRLQVWELVDKPFGKTVIKLKWLYKNKKDEDQTANRKEVYVVQPDGFVDLDHLDKVYCIRKALYGMKQALRAWYDELLNFLMSKGFTKGESIGTPMDTKPKLDADLSGKLVDQTDYHSKIRSLMYLTSGRLDIGQAVCYCARYQEIPTKKHLNEVKRIFRYLRGTINMGLWYLKDSGFKLTACLDATMPDFMIIAKALIEEYSF